MIFLYFVTSKYFAPLNILVLRPYIDVLFLSFAMQAQAGWLQHDFGHLSVFKNSTWDHLLHKFVIGHVKVPDQDTYNYRTIYYKIYTDESNHSYYLNNMLLVLPKQLWPA